MTRAHGSWLVALVSLTAVSLALGPASCSDEVIVLAKVPFSDAGPTASLTRCVDLNDCPVGSFCERAACGDSAGVCQPFPSVCDDDEHPVCGCDGITYFNDCLRQAAGVSFNHPDVCRVGTTCIDPNGCPSGTECGHLLGLEGDPRSCAPGAAGNCWVLPAMCPRPTRAERWNECTPNPGGLPCIDTCQAIRSGRSYVRARRCQ